MTCVNGRINPTTTTRLRLFADSGGFCSHPSRLAEIFIDLDSRAIHVGEIAHVISAGDSGPRSDSDTTPEQRSQYENLILLCPRCHTIIDKAEEEYPRRIPLDITFMHQHEEQEFNFVSGQGAVHVFEVWPNTYEASPCQETNSP